MTDRPWILRGQTSTLTCPTCGEACDDLRYFRWCMYCWYVFCGGDRASDEDLAILPSVWIS